MATMQVSWVPELAQCQRERLDLRQRRCRIEKEPVTRHAPKLEHQVTLSRRTDRWHEHGGTGHGVCSRARPSVLRRRAEATLGRDRLLMHRHVLAESTGALAALPPPAIAVLPSLPHRDGGTVAVVGPRAIVRRILGGA